MLENKKSYIASNSTLRLILKKLPLVVCWWSAKEYPQLPGRLVKQFFFLLHLYEATVLKYTSTELQVTRAEMRIQLSSIKPNSKDIYKCAK